jgi:hypothetical protein
MQVAGQTEVVKKIVHNRNEIPVLTYEKPTPAVDLKLRRRSSLLSLIPDGILYPINYGISSTLRKLPVVFHPDKHSAALGVRNPSTCMSFVPAGTLNAQPTCAALLIRQLKLEISRSPSEKNEITVPSTTIRHWHALYVWALVPSVS